MPFQKQVNVEPAFGIPGQFASNNPYATFVAGEGALVAGTNGVVVAAFAWADSETRAVYNSAPSGDEVAPDGFVFNDGTASIANIYDESNMTFPEGYMVTLMVAGDFYAVTTTVATVGQKVFASLSDGTISTAAPGGTVSGSIETEFYVRQAGVAGDIIKIGTWK